MTDKEVVNQLNKLKKVQPDSAWQAKNRALLLNQISASSEESPAIIKSGFSFSILKLPSRLMKTIPQPVMAVFLIVLFMFGSGIFSIQASRNTKPGDSLYIAKIISEKTQQALTFDDKKKAQLGIEFASNRVEELTQILSDTSESNEIDKKAKVEDLVNNFKKEIDGVKNHIAKISSQKIEQPSLKTDDNNLNNPESKIEINKDDSAVFSANLSKDDQGIEISEPIANKTKATSGDEKLIVAEETTTATSAPGLGENASSSADDLTPVSNPSETQEILNQAGVLLENEEYDATISKLNEAGEAMDLAGAGEVKGEAESATTTGEVLGAEEIASSTKAVEK